MPARPALWGAGRSNAPAYPAAQTIKYFFNHIKESVPKSRVVLNFTVSINIQAISNMPESGQSGRKPRDNILVVLEAIMPCFNFFFV